MPPPPMGPPPQFPPPGGFAQPGMKVSVTGQPLASWGIRVGGALIDGVIFAVLNFILQAAFHKSQTLRLHYVMTNNGTTKTGSISFLVLILAAVIYLLYGTLMIGARGQTIGMMAVGIRAVRDVDGGPVGPGKAFVRSLAQLIMSWTFILILLSDLWPLWDAKRQTLQDKVVGSVVIRVRS